MVGVDLVDATEALITLDEVLLTTNIPKDVVDAVLDLEVAALATVIQASDPEIPAEATEHIARVVVDTATAYVIATS